MGKLSERLNNLVDSAESDNRTRSDVVGRMAAAAGIEPSTVNQILDGDIMCPPINRLRGFADVLDVSVTSLRMAAEQDGCNYQNTSSRPQQSVKAFGYGYPVPVQGTKAHKDHWEVSGYLSTYGNVDLGSDVVEPGAFDRWLASGSKTRFLYSHRPDKVLGVFQEMKSDQTGLFARARISQTPLGEEAYTLIKDGALDSFSIGYVTVESERKGNNRHLLDLDLPEGSLIAIPMNPQAAVTAWKDWVSIFELEAEPTLAEKAEMLGKAMNELVEDTRGLLNSVDRPLSQKKQDELGNLLKLCDGLDDVRSSLKSVLTLPVGVVEARRLQYELGEKRKRLSHILGD